MPQNRPTFGTHTTQNTHTRLLKRAYSPSDSLSSAYPLCGCRFAGRWIAHVKVAGAQKLALALRATSGRRCADVQIERAAPLEAMREACATTCWRECRALASKAVREGARRRTEAGRCVGHGERAGPAPLALSQLPPLRLVERVPLSRTREIATPTEAASSGICSRIMYTPPLRPTYR